MDLNSSNKHAAVQAWLKEVLGPLPQPKYEINDETIELLYRLATGCQEREAHCQRLAKDLQLKTAEYESEVSRLESVLSPFKVSVNRLTSSGASSTRSIARLACLLELKDTALPNFFAALSALSSDLYMAQENYLQQKQADSALQARSNQALVRLAEVKRSLEELQASMAGNEALLEKRVQERAFYKGKAAEYQATVAGLKDAQAHAGGLDPSLSHSALVLQSETLKKMQQELSTIQATLKSFQSLPPDVTLARLRIEESRKELARLEDEVTKGFNAIHA